MIAGQQGIYETNAVFRDVICLVSYCNSVDDNY
jgi:hypothetical protein